MARLSDAQIAAVAAGAGLGRDDPEAPLGLWVAIALAESNEGDPQARNWCCTGLWQIHKQHAGAVPGSPADQEAFRDWLETPANNAAAAKWIYDRQGLGAWEVFTNGRYRRYTDRGQRAALDYASGAILPGGFGDPAGDIAGAVPDVAGAIREAVQVATDAGAWLSDRENWTRIAFVALGGAVVIAGLAVLARPALEPVAKKVPALS